MDKQTKFILAISAQLLIIFGIILFKLSVLSGGTVVTLEIAPVDPRDPLRGDYVTFQYDISQVNSYSHKSIRNGETVYVPLYTSSFDSHWQAGSSITKKLPENQGNKVYIKGTVLSGGDPAKSVSKTSFGNSSKNLRIKYNIE